MSALKCSDTSGPEGLITLHYYGMEPTEERDGEWIDPFHVEIDEAGVQIHPITETSPWLIKGWKGSVSEAGHKYDGLKWKASKRHEGAFTNIVNLVVLDDEGPLYSGIAGVSGFEDWE